MIDQDWRPFCEMWITASAASANGKQLSESICRYAFELLQDYPLPDVVSAIMRHGKSSKFAPTPCEIIEIINSASKHYAADEAWAIVLKSFDEQETVVMTAEMLEAKAETQEVFDAGDTVGARMAFRAAYERIIRYAPPPAWRVSVGYDPHRRYDAVFFAVAKGLLPKGTEQKYLEQAPQDAGPIAGLLTGKVENPPADNASLKKRWGMLKGAIAEAVAYEANQKIIAKEAEKTRRLNFERNREEQLAKFAAISMVLEA